MSIDAAGALAKIDRSATLGLSGSHDSLGYRVEEIERHHHAWERWFGLATVPVGETHRGDPIGTTVAPFVADAGNLTWGAWLQFVGSDDTPTDGVSAYMDMHQMTVVAAERATTAYFIQIAWGDSGAAALAAGTYSEIVYWSGANVSRAAPVEVRMHRVATGTKGWIRILAVGQDTGTLSFFCGGHEYLA